MPKIDLGKLLKNSPIKKGYVAEKLYPKHKHPGRALQDVINGVTQLNTEQIVILSEVLGKPISELFTE